MSRQHRLEPAGAPRHIVQRGNDRQLCFVSDAGHHRYLGNLREIALREGDHFTPISHPFLITSADAYRACKGL